MILIDVNLLIYASDPPSPQNSAPHYLAAKAWLDEQLNETARVGIPWQTILGYLRIMTNSRIVKHPATLNAAWGQVQAWLDCPNVWIPVPGPQAPAYLKEVLAHAQGGADLVPDAALAALAIEHGLTLCSTDGDFARFPGLKWLNPLAPRRRR